ELGRGDVDSDPKDAACSRSERGECAPRPGGEPEPDGGARPRPKQLAAVERPLLESSHATIDSTMPFLGELARTVAKVLVTLLALSAVVFLLSSAHGDPSKRFLGSTATPAQLAIFRHEHGLDRPLPVRYAEWLGGAVHGDFGRSYVP